MPGITAQSCSESGVNRGAIHDGDHAAYRDYDFDSGVTAFKARASPKRVSPTRSKTGKCATTGHGLSVVNRGLDGAHALAASNAESAFAYAPDVDINEPHTVVLLSNTLTGWVLAGRSR